VQLLDTDLKIRDGDDHEFYNQFNKIDLIKHVVVVYKNDTPIGCGAIKKYDTSITEIKRMFVLPESRSNGLASMILNELEKWASELSFNKCILETGINQLEAIHLYSKNGYTLMPNYGQYEGIKDSRCFCKLLK
tara:strand:+ start:13503 stop:13904 length:402 start_codon:yes stop_codon:yes gene_type:complete